MFLTPQQLYELTALTQGAAQIRWLRKNGIDHFVRADGKPRVLPAALLGRELPRPKPRFEALRQRA